MHEDWAPPQRQVFLVVKQSDNPLLVHLVGELDLATADAASTVLEKLTTPGEPVALDLRRLTFIDCTGVRVIEQLLDRLDGAILSLVNVPPATSRLLCLLGLDQVAQLNLPVPAMAVDA